MRDRRAGRGLELGKELHGLTGLGPGQEENGMNLVRNGIGRQDRLVFLGSFRAHEMFEISIPQHDPGSEVHALFLGDRTRGFVPGFFQAGSGWSACPACRAADFGGSAAGTTRRTARTRAGVHDSPRLDCGRGSRDDPFIKHLEMSVAVSSGSRLERSRERSAIAEFLSNAGARKRPPELSSGGLCLVFDQIGFAELASICEQIRRRPTECRAAPLPPRG